MEKTVSLFASPATISSIAIIAAAIILLLFLRRFFKIYSHSEKGKGERASVVRLAFDVFRILLVIFAIMLVMKINGINLISVIAGLGIVSAVIGLAMQDFIKDIIMGIYIVRNHFFSVGECVEYQGREGMVVGFNLTTTKIGDMEDHSVYTICNRNISEIHRYARRLDIDVPLAYDEDPKIVRATLCEICKQIAAEVEGVTQCDFLGTQSFESSSILYRIRIFCESKYRPDTRRAALGIIQDALDSAGIEIPYNQIDVHLDTLQPQK